MANKIQCTCGECSVQFSSPPRFALECACVDCFQKLEWCVKQGATFTVPSIPKLVYFASDVVGTSGEERMRKYLLRPSGRSVFVVATCCKSMLMVDHPEYRNNIAMHVVEGAVGDFEDVEPIARIFMKDFDERRGPPSPFAGVTLYGLDDERDNREERDEIFNNQFDRSDVVNPKGERLAALLARLGETNVLDLSEGVSL